MHMGSALIYCVAYCRDHKSHLLIYMYVHTVRVHMHKYVYSTILLNSVYIPDVRPSCDLLLLYLYISEHRSDACSHDYVQYAYDMYIQYICMILYFCVCQTVTVHTILLFNVYHIIHKSYCIS